MVTTTAIYSREQLGISRTLLGGAISSACHPCRETHLLSADALRSYCWLLLPVGIENNTDRNFITHPDSAAAADISSRNRPYSRNKVVQTVLQPVVDKLGTEWSGSVLNCPQLHRTCPSVCNRPFLSEIPANSFKSPLQKFSCTLTSLCYMYTPHTTMSTTNLYRHALEKLAAEPPTTKSALLYSLLSEIEAALRSGKTQKQIRQRLSDAGLDITCETFCRLIRRARKKPRISGARGGKSAALSELPAQQTATGVEHDPLANLRRVEAFIIAARKT